MKEHSNYKTAVCSQISHSTSKDSSAFMLAMNGVPVDVVSDVICFCIANKRENTEWVHLPIANFDCYYGNTNFSKKWLSKIPDTILEREVASGICRVKLKI